MHDEPPISDTTLWRTYLREREKLRRMVNDEDAEQHEEERQIVYSVAVPDDEETYEE
jgi:hypothetical protein